MNKQKGFTVIELVVGIGVMLLLGAVVVPMVLHHLYDSKLAHGTEDMLNVHTALRSALLQNEGKLPEPASGDYMETLLALGVIDRAPQSLDASGPWKILKSTTGGQDYYYLDIPCATSMCQKLVADLDLRSDAGGGSGNGVLRWNF